MKLAEMTDEQLVDSLFVRDNYNELFRRWAPDLQSWLRKHAKPDAAMRAFSAAWLGIESLEFDKRYRARPAFFSWAASLIEEPCAA